MFQHYDKLIAVMHYFSRRDVEVNCLAAIIFFITITHGMVKLNKQLSFVKIYPAPYVLQTQ
jgi:hypothetical protein